MQNIYKIAVDCQDACNLSGVAHSLASEVLPQVWEEVRANGGGTAEVNRHPAIRLILSKLADLAGLVPDDMGQYGADYTLCSSRALEAARAAETADPVAA